MNNMHTAPPPYRGYEFARLIPADRPAKIAFDRIASKMKADPNWNQHARKYVAIYPQQSSFEYVDSEGSECEDGSGPQPQERMIWWGFYRLAFDIPPRDVRLGWLLGGGKFALGDESPELVLTEKKQHNCILGRHARLVHDYSSGALVLKIAAQGSAIVDGKEVRDSIVIWSVNTLITLGTMSYNLQLDGAADIAHRGRLGLYQQAHGLVLKNYPMSLLSTPAPTDYIHKDYIIKNPVGHGDSSTVFAGMHIKTSAVVAIKRIARNDDNADEVEQEVQISTYLGVHSRLCRLTDMMSPDGDRQSAHFRACDEVYLVYQPLATTTWLSLCEGEGMTEAYNTLCTKLFEHCLEGVEYIHSRGVMHRDIKPENLAIISFHPPQSRLIDFGSATMDTSSKDVTAGTEEYHAPEMWRIIRSGDSSDPETYDNKIDMFALGLSACQIFCMRGMYWDAEADIEVVASLKAEIRYRQIVSPAVKKLIRSMLADDADLRPSAEEALESLYSSNARGSHG